MPPEKGDTPERGITTVVSHYHECFTYITVIIIISQPYTALTMC